MRDPDHPGGSSQNKTIGLQRFLRAAQRIVGISGEVNVLVTSSAQMRRLNRDFRGKDKPTDVLSFPVAQNGNVKLAGDIAVSKEIAQSNAKALGHSLDTELKVLLLHGLLHLAGHDHESDNGEMAALEQKMRAKLKLPTGLIERANHSSASVPSVPSVFKSRGQARSSVRRVRCS
jgi:probable rRNA maturation factor